MYITCMCVCVCVCVTRGQGPGCHSEPQSRLEATESLSPRTFFCLTLRTCWMGSSVNVRDDSHFQTYVRVSACSWRLSLTEEERSLLLALAVDLTTATLK